MQNDPENVFSAYYTPPVQLLLKYLIFALTFRQRLDSRDHRALGTMSRSDQSVCGFKSLWGKLGSTLQRKTGHLSAASVRGKAGCGKVI